MIDIVVPNYRILKRIASEGMGEVYLAEHMDLRRKDVLKFILPQYNTDPDFNARFKREAQAVAALNHPNIITIYNFGEEQNHAWIAMEYADGGSLEGLMADQELSIPQVVDIVMQICNGLCQAHHRGVLHRDLKPANILRNKSGQIKIADFGLAKMKDGPTLTSTGAIMGTPSYMSPEQVRGQKLDERSDIFSFGIIIYKLITLRHPFQGETVGQIFEAILTQAPEPLARYKGGVSAGLQRIIDKALDKNLETRYQHIDEMLADLKKLEKEQTLAPQPPVKDNDEPVPKPITSTQTATPTSVFKWRVVVTISVVALVLIVYFLGLKKESPSAGDGGPVIIAKDMAFIPAGNFLMGSADGSLDEKPVREISLDTFYMDTCEVTVEQYQRFIIAHSYPQPDDWTEQLKSLDHPVVNVSWDDANAFAKWAGKRLPTEAEWEYAVRGGLAGKKYPWEKEGISANDANFNDSRRWRNTAPVGQFISNNYGLYDMLGNVREWCADWYGNYTASGNPERNPTGPQTGKKRVLRGGSWKTSGMFLTVSARDSEPPTVKANDLGFRCVKDQ